jgi:hypothetical protein
MWKKAVGSRCTAANPDKKKAVIYQEFKKMCQDDRAIAFEYLRSFGFTVLFVFAFCRQ